MKLDRLSLLTLAGLCSCVADPLSNGQPLLCSEDTECEERFGEGWRCLSGGCVLNAPPQIDGFALADDESFEAGPFFVRQPMTVTVRVAGTDSDGDTVSFTWIEEEESRPLPDRRPAQSFTGNSITIESTTPGQPLSLGSYRYRVVPNDDRVDGAARTVVVTIVAAGDVIFVSQLTGEDSDSCGTIERPCRSLGQALSRSPGSTIQLAAAASPYFYCLGRDAPGTFAEPVPIAMEGCFDPLSWEPVSSRRRECEIQCEPDSITVDADEFGVGHVLVGPSRLYDVTLTLNPQTVLPAEIVAGTALLQPNVDVNVPEFDRIELTNVDVVAPGCGDSCVSVGVGAQDVEVAIDRVDVVADAREFSPVFSFIGISLERSRGTVVGGLLGATIPSAPDARKDLVARSRGRISLNAPASSDAVGVSAIDFSGTLRGLAVTGGIGLGISGFNLEGGSPVLEDNLVDVLGFSTRAVSGFTLHDCSADGGCAISGATPADRPLNAIVRNNTVYLAGASELETSSPCVGLGVQLDSRSANQVIESNTVVLGSEFTLGIGASIALDDQGSNTSFASVSSNHIAVRGANRDELCVLINGELGLPFNAGLLGVRVSGSTRARVDRNRIEIGHLSSSEDPYSVGPELISTGISVTSAQDSTDPMRVTQNEVLVGQGPSQSFALSTDTSRIEIVNNLLYGGDTPRSGGLLILATDNDVDTNGQSSTPFPILRHNTIHGGGVLGRTASSRGLQLSLAPVSLELDKLRRIGTLTGNLIDGGWGQGRRHIVDNEMNQGEPLLPGVTFAPSSDYGQLVGAASEERPVAATASLNGRGERWRVFTAAGEVLSLSEEESPSRLELVDEAPVRLDRPVYDVEEFDAGTGRVVAASTAGIGIASIVSDSSASDGAFDVYPLGDVELIDVLDVTTRATREDLQVLVLAETADGPSLFATASSNGFTPLTPFPVIPAGRPFLLLARSPAGTVLGLRAGTAAGYELVQIAPTGELKNVATLLGTGVPRELVPLRRGLSIDSSGLDFALVHDGGLEIFLDVQGGTPRLCAAGASFPDCDDFAVTATDVCVGGVASGVLELPSSDAEQLFLVGCSTGEVEIQSRVGDTLSFVSRASVSEPSAGDIDSPITALAARPGLTMRRARVLALLPDAGVLAVFELDENSLALTPGPIYGDFANVALRTTNGVPLQSLTQVSDLTLVAPSVSCEVIAPAPMSETPEEERDRIRNLRLLGGSCVNSTELTLEPLDVDVDGVMRDCEPDVGASELTSSPGACP